MNAFEGSYFFKYLYFPTFLYPGSKRWILPEISPYNTVSSSWVALFSHLSSKDLRTRLMNDFTTLFYVLLSLKSRASSLCYV